MRILPRSIAALWRSPKVDVAMRERLSAWQRLPRADLSLPHRHARYVVVDVTNGASEGILRLHFYDLGDDLGHRLVAIERPEP